MEDKREANRFDKVFKENVEAVTVALVEKVLAIPVARAERIQADLPKTLERKPDQLLRITDRLGDTFLLHLEFQLADEAHMAERMLEYWILLRRKYRLPVRQYVLFLADRHPRMNTRLDADNVRYFFQLIPMTGIDYRLFLDSGNPDEIVFAVLGDFRKQPVSVVVDQIVDRLRTTSPTLLEFDRHLEQLRVLAILRKLKPIVEDIMKSIAKYIKPEDDPWYRQAMSLGLEQGIEQGVERGVEQGVELEKERRNRAFVQRLLEKTAFHDEQIAELVDVPVAFVRQVRAGTA